MDPELIATIEATVYEIWRTKERIRALNASGKPVPLYLKGYLRRLDRDLNKMRSVAVYYREYSSIENLQLLGENYIKQMKRDLTTLTFQTSILCQRIGIAKDGFYSSMREGHKYDGNNNEYLESLGLDVALRHPDIVESMSSLADGDVDPDAPICIGMDYNANINWIVAGQPRDRRLNVIKSFYVKFERKIPALVEDFCRYYASHRNKTVVYYIMLRPSAQTMPSTTRTSTIMWLRSSSGTAGASSPCTSETRCTMTRSIFSSTTPLPESKD